MEEITCHQLAKQKTSEFFPELEADGSPGGVKPAASLGPRGTCVEGEGEAAGPLSHGFIQVEGHHSSHVCHARQGSPSALSVADSAVEMHAGSPRTVLAPGPAVS